MLGMSITIMLTNKFFLQPFSIEFTELLLTQQRKPTVLVKIDGIERVAILNFPLNTEVKLKFFWNSTKRRSIAYFFFLELELFQRELYR